MKRVKVIVKSFLLLSILLLIMIPCLAANASSPGYYNLKVASTGTTEIHTEIENATSLVLNETEYDYYSGSKILKVTYKDCISGKNYVLTIVKGTENSGSIKYIKQIKASSQTIVFDKVIPMNLSMESSGALYTFYLSSNDGKISTPLKLGSVQYYVPDPSIPTEIEIDDGSSQISAEINEEIPLSGSVTYSFNAKIYDQYENEMKNQNVEWSISESSVGVTISNGQLKVDSTATDGTVTVVAKTGNISKSFVVHLQSLKITWPYESIAAVPVYGDSWSDIVALNGGSAKLGEKDISGTFSLVTSGNPKAGDNSYAVNFKSTDAKYNVTKSAESVNVSKRVAVWTWDEETSFRYTGMPQGISATITNAVAGDTVSLIISGNSNTLVSTQAYTATVTGVSDSNYTIEGSSSAKSKSYQILPAEQAKIQFDTQISEKTYNDGTFSVSVSGGSGTGNFSLTSSDENVLTVISQSTDGKTFTIGVGNAGTATLSLGKEGDDNYIAMASGMATQTVTVNKLPVKAPKVNSNNTFDYDGTLHTYEIASSEWYNIDGNQQTDAGHYGALVSLKDKNNTCWSDTTDLNGKVYEFTINPMPVEKPQEDQTAYVYTGKTQTYGVTSNEYYDVRNATATDVGTYSVTIQLKSTQNTYWKGTSKDVSPIIYDFVIQKASVTVKDQANINADMQGNVIKLAGTATDNVNEIILLFNGAETTAISKNEDGSWPTAATVSVNGLEFPVEVSITTQQSDILLETGAPRTEVSGKVAAADQLTVSESISSASTTVIGVTASAAEALTKAAETADKSSLSSSEYGYIYETVVSPSFEALSYGDSAYELEISLNYSVLATPADAEGNKDAGKVSVTMVSDAVLPNEDIKTPVTVSVVLPDGFPHENLIVIHTKADKTTEYFPVSVQSAVENGKTVYVASWSQSSFSNVKIVEDSSVGTGIFNFADGSRVLTEYKYSDIEKSLPSDAKDGATFDGWKIGNAVYNSLTSALMKELDAKGYFIADAKFTVVDPDAGKETSGNNGGSSSGGSSGGASSGGSVLTQKKEYTITALPTVHGVILAGESAAEAGTAITMAAIPQKGYLVKSVSAADESGNQIPVTDNGDGTCSFIMPDSAVSLSAAFAAEKAGFTDVSESDWYYDAVMWAVSKGITSGTGDGTTFSPSSVCTRAEIVQFLYGNAGAPNADRSALSRFMDVSEKSWYADAAGWAVTQGITSGAEDGTVFRGEHSCTRAQIITMLYNGFHRPDIDVKVLSEFNDVPDDAWYADAVAWAVANGITAGTGDGTTFSPNAVCTRAQAVTLIYNAYGK